MRPSALSRRVVRYMSFESSTLTSSFFFFLNDTATTEIYTLSLHDALPIPIADGSSGDVITLDAAINSAFPNGRRLGGGSAPNRHQVNVNSVLISLIVAGDPGLGLGKGVEVNDKDFLNRFPFLAPAHQGLLQGHGCTNVPT